MQVIFRTIDIEFLDLRATVPNRATDHRAVELHPFIGASQRSQPPLKVDLPGTDEKIEIVLSIVR
jgi:hypothetical protein